MNSEVNDFLSRTAHPLAAEIQPACAVIFAADASIRDEVKWNSVSFRNEHDFFATINLRSLKELPVILYTGVKTKPTARTGVPVPDPSGLIERWAAIDRCIVTLGKGAQLRANEAAFTALLRAWIRCV